MYLCFNVWQVNITDCVIQSWQSGDLGLPTDKKNKQRVEHEPRSAHGHAVDKPWVDYEPCSANGRAVNYADRSLSRDISYTDKAFCLKTPSPDIVFNLLRKMDEKKATGLDMIPSKLLKMAASIVALSLTAIFTKSVITGIYPTKWKTARVKNRTSTIIIKFSLFRLSQRFLKKLFTNT